MEINKKPAVRDITNKGMLRSYINMPGVKDYAICWDENLSPVECKYSELYTLPNNQHLRAIWEAKIFTAQNAMLKVFVKQHSWRYKIKIFFKRILAIN